MSRDSGDCFIGTTNSVEDALQSGGTAVNAGGLHSALQGHQHWLSRADIALILSAEIACENDEEFGENLPYYFMSFLWHG